MKFEDIEYDDPDTHNNLMIVDGLNLAFRFKHAKTKNYSAQYIRTIRSLANSYKAGRVIILGDGGSYYRKGLYPEYKANREELKKKQTEEESKEFEKFLEEFNKILEILSNNYLTMRYGGIEADDIAAYIVNKFRGDFDHVWLISSDKDWDLLINDNVSRFSYVTKKEIRKDNWSEHYDYSMDQHIDIKVLQGDKGDHIPGCEGVGVKRAYSLVSKYGSALDIYDSLPLPGTQKFIQNINKFGDSILLNFELMDLITYSETALGKDCGEIHDRIERYIV